MRSASGGRRVSSLGVGLLTFALVGVVSAGFVVEAGRRRSLVERAQVSLLASEHAHAMQRNIERAISGVYALAALVRQGEGEVADFEGVASRLLPFYPGVTGLGLAPKGVVKQIEPRGPNAGAVGHDLLNDPARAREAVRARDTGQLTLAGPFVLRQGGYGAVARLPVFLERERGAAEFWGFTIVVLQFPGVLEAERMSELSRRGYAYELSRVHPDTGERQVLARAGPAELIEPVATRVEVPNGVWTLSVAPAAGWGERGTRAAYAAIGLAFSVLLGAVAKLLVDLRARQQDLEALVARRTAEVRAREADLNRAQEIARTGSWSMEVSRENAELVEASWWSRETYRVLGVAGAAPLSMVDYAERIHPGDRDRFRGAMAALLKGEPLNVEFRVVHEDRLRWVRARGECHRDAGSALCRCVGLVQDVTEQRLAEQRLQESEARLRSAVTNSPMPIMIHADDGEILVLSDSWVEITGYTREELPNLAAWTERAYGESSAAVLRQIGDLYGRSGRVREGEYPVRTKAGQTRTWDFMSAPLGALSDGRRIAISMAMDVTERLRSEFALRDSEDRYRALVKHAPAAVFVCRSERIALVNDACLTLFGAGAAEELLGRSPFDLFHRDFHTEIRQRLHQLTALAERVPTVEEQIVRLDGTVVDVEVTAAPFLDQGERAAHVVMRDITERKKVQDALRKSEESLAITLQSIGDAVIATDAAGRITRMNPAAERMTGWEIAEARGRVLGEIFQLTGEGPHGAARDPVAQVLERGKVIELPGFTGLRSRDGTVHQIADSAAPIRDQAGRIVGVVLVFSDVTEQYRVQQVLRESEQRSRLGEERLELALEGAELGLWDWHMTTDLVNYDARWCSMLGYAVDDVPANLSGWDRLVHPEDKPVVQQRLDAHFSGRDERYESEHRLRHRDGSWIWVLDRGKVTTRDAAGRPQRMSGTHMNITARKQAEESLRASLREKEALLREVHHRVKNNLQIITSLLRLESGRIDHPLTRTVLVDMQNRIRSMALLHETLYRSGQFAQVDLASYFRELCGHLFRSMAGTRARTIELRLELVPVSLGLDQAIPCGLVLSELASNALKHGFPHDAPGHVRVELERLDGGTSLRLRVSDSGVGLPPGFNPGRMKTLGLQLVADLTRQLGGELHVEPPAPVFTLTFPIAAPRAPLPDTP